MTATCRNVRFIRFDSASQASRSSPSMSSSNRSSRSSLPEAMSAERSPMRPQRHAVVVGDEAERPGADAIEAARQQHAERLVCQPALERVGDEIVAVAARERLDQHLVAPGNDGALLLQLQPIGDRRRQPAPRVIVGEHGAHALGEMRRQRELAAVVAGDDGIAGAGAGDERLVLAHALEAQHLAGQHEGVAGAQLLDEILVDLAHDAAAGHRLARSGGAAADEAHLDQRRGDDGAGVHAIGLDEARMRNAQLAARRRP